MTREPETKPLCPNCKSCEIVPLMGELPGSPPYTHTVARPPVAQCAEDQVEETAGGWRCKNCGHEWTEEGPD